MDNELLVKILERIATIEQIQHSINDKLAEIVPLKKDVSKLKLDVNTLENRLAQHEKELAELKESNKWLRRLFVSSIITMVTGILVAVLKGFIGV